MTRGHKSRISLRCEASHPRLGSLASVPDLHPRPRPRFARFSHGVNFTPSVRAAASSAVAREAHLMRSSG